MSQAEVSESKTCTGARTTHAHTPIHTEVENENNIIEGNLIFICFPSQELIGGPLALSEI